MDYRYRRSYCGPLRAAIFDWAGTVVDHGSNAPTRVLVEAFAADGITVTLAQARKPMGLPKREHIRTIAAEPDVAAQWQARFGRSVSAADIDALYERFLPLQVAGVGAYSEVIAGVVTVIAQLRARGLRIGSTTGYPRAVMDELAPRAAAQGFAPDVIYGEGYTPAGRPAPYMALAAMADLGVYPVQACVKVDDTVPGVEEGLNAGMWTVAVVDTGNEVGLTAEELCALESSERERLCGRAAQRLVQAGAHYLVRSVAELLPVIEDIERRLAHGERP